MLTRGFFLCVWAVMEVFLVTQVTFYCISFKKNYLRVIQGEEGE